jgi:hypothetical protein
VLRINGATKEVVLIAGGDPVPGPAGTDGREIELQTSATHIQWRYVGETTWLNLIALSAITGPAGDDGEDGAPGAPGADGVDGREIELQVTATHIQWRYVGSATWTNLVALSVITGPAGDDGAPGAPGSDGDDGREIELQTSLTHIQWRYTGGTWINLIALADLEGEQGLPGAPGEDGREIELQTSLTHIQWRYTGGTWINLIALSALKGDPGEPGADGEDGITPHIGANGNWYIGLTDTGVPAQGEDGAPGTPGADGDDGREVELQVNATHIQWRYTYDALWTDLIALSELQGEPGQDGADGASTYYTTHTLALSGIVPENTYFPGFTIDRILVSGSYTENQKIVRIAGRTLSGSVGIAIHRIIHGQSTGAKILPPSSSTYSIGNTGNTYDVDYSLSHNNYIYFFIPLGYVNLGEDLSVTITIEHTPASGGGGLEIT